MSPVTVPLREIRALYSAETITVYQAYPMAIAGPAAAEGRFPPDYDRGRMTWIKPSFLWMMYRSSWGTAFGQERVLAIRLRRGGFESALARAVASSYTGQVHASHDQWKRDLRRSPVRIQWDPERDIRLRPLPWRSLQIGLRGEAVNSYLDDWITGIDDITELAHSVHARLLEGSIEQATALVPAERPYPLPSDVASRIDATPSAPTEDGSLHTGAGRARPKTGAPLA